MILSTRRMTNGTCVSFCNQPKAHFGLPGHAPGTIAVNVTRGFNACQTHRNMYPSIFNRFPVIQPVSSKVRFLVHFLHILAFPGYAPGQSRKMLHGWKEDSMLVKHIFFNCLGAIARYWSEIATFFLPPCI